MALGLVTTRFQQGLELALGFHPFGEGEQSEGPRHRDGGPHDRSRLSGSVPCSGKVATDRPRAHALLERIRQALEATPLRIAHDQVVHIRLSVGLASTSGIASWQLQPLLEAADAALHVAKDLGRNLVVDLEELSRDPQWQVRLV